MHPLQGPVDKKRLRIPVDKESKKRFLIDWELAQGEKDEEEEED